MKLIDKDTIIAEIERRIKSLNKDRDFNYLQIKELEALLSFLDTLEVKGVDLEKELNDYGYHYDYVSLASRKELVDFARHFFELGLKTQKGE